MDHPKVPTGSRRMIGLLHGIAPRNLWSALGLFIAGLIFIVFVSFQIKTNVEAAAQREFDFACSEIEHNIADRLTANVVVLHSGAALLDASGEVTREEWRIFTQNLQLEQHLPGIQGIGFALLIPREQLAQHIQNIRSQGFPDYQVTPAGEREIYSSIIYLEPFKDRNLRAFGYDMFSEPVRRAAMERARDENADALSGKVTLVQETNEDVQAGVPSRAAGRNR
jgi:CHASE1-domain containing sensor protein